MTSCAIKAVDVVNFSQNLHYKLGGGNQLSAHGACSAWAIQLYVVVFTQDHSAFGITRRSHISQTHVAARTFQAVYMPVLIQGEQKKSIQNFFSASPTTSYSTLKATIVYFRRHSSLNFHRGRLPPEVIRSFQYRRNNNGMRLQPLTEAHSTIFQVLELLRKNCPQFSWFAS